MYEYICTCTERNNMESPIRLFKKISEIYSNIKHILQAEKICSNRFPAQIWLIYSLFILPLLLRASSMNSEAGWKYWFMGNLAVSVAWSPRNLISVPTKYSSSVLIWLNFVPWAQFTTWVTPFRFNSSLFLAIKLGGRIFFF